jgi:hypothetical protein
MNRVLRVLLILIWLEMGLILILIPWTGVWETNYFLNRYPDLIQYFLNPYVRGAISGLGLMDAVLALEAFRRGPTTGVRRS